MARDLPEFDTDVDGLELICSELPVALSQIHVK